MNAFWSKTFSILMLVMLVVTGAGGIPVARPETGAAYIVQGFDTAETVRLVEQAGGVVTSRLDIIHAVGAHLSPAALTSLRGNPRIQRVTANAPASSSDQIVQGRSDRIPATDYADVTGADLVWQQGVTGNGIGVAVMDTGLSLHPALLKDLNGKPRKIVGWADFIDKKFKLPHDPNGHGTHIAGIIANAQTGADNEWNGTAPGVNLVGVRVLDANGEGTYETIIQGIQWVIQNKAKYNIRVMNLSLQATVQSAYWADPLNQAVMAAWAEGIVVVTVAGNAGPGPMTLTVPGNNPYAITVGAFTDNYTPGDWSDDYITPFSGAGPTLDGFAKPDLIAPGAHMVSPMSPGSTIVRNHEANWVNGLYFSMAGTSQAAAVTSAAAALILARNPGLTPNQVKYRLMVTALPWIKADGSDVLYSIWQQGAGRLNVYDAVMSDDPQVTGEANNGMDIAADLRGEIHYEGYSYYDETIGAFRLHGAEDWTSGFGTWSGGFGTWSGGFGTWSGGFGTWSGGFGTWSGGFGTWSGGFGTWSGGFGTWSGGFGTWSGGFGTWSGGFGTWSGGFGTWSGSVPWAANGFADPAFVANYLSGAAPNATQKTANIIWVEE
jgi:serine protease AprX